MADYQYLTSQGVIVPDTSTLRDDVESEYRSVFGQQLDVSPETPQGALITMEVENRDAVVRNNAELANQINPDLAGGIFLDAIWALMGGQRFYATYSTLTNVIFTGIAGTLIPQGSLAETILGDRFKTVADLIIGKDGKAVGEMQAVNTGAITCAIGQLNQVASSVLGWETIFNPTPAVQGRDNESDLKSRHRRKLTLAKNTVSIGEAITSALYDLDGVKSLSFLENYTNEPLIIEEIELCPHSIYVCVYGGNDIEIAEALLRTKTVGAGFNGNIEVSVRDKISGQHYRVKFDRAKEKTLFCRVTVKSPKIDAQTLIPDIVDKWAQGDISSDSGVAVGREVSPFEISAGINMVEPSLFVTRVELSTDGKLWSSDTYPICIDEIAILQKTAVQVVIE